MDTLLLDRTTWDLVLDSAGNIAVASPPYAVAQDVASAIRLFAGELWFNTAKGVPYFDEFLGKFPTAELLKSKFVKAALTVPTVTAAVCYLTSLTERSLSGQVQVTYSTTATTSAQAVISFVGDSTGFTTA